MSLLKRWRLDRNFERIIRELVSDDGPSDHDLLVGIVETRELAKHIVQIHNRWVREQEEEGRADEADQEG